MSHEVITMVKRTIYVAKCDTCKESVELVDRTAKERFCGKCNKWVPFVEESFTGPPLSK